MAGMQNVHEALAALPSLPSSATPVARSLPRRAFMRFFLRSVPFFGIVLLRLCQL